MRRKKVVLDTNVVVSAHLNADGYEAYVLDLALISKLELCLSPEILTEYQEVLRRKKFAIDPKKIALSLQLIKSKAQIVHPRRRVSAALDPEDNKFLECVEEAQAHFLVTGNKRHFPRKWQSANILNAKEFVELIVLDLQR